jgi:hypothetical protein
MNDHIIHSEPSFQINEADQMRQSCINQLYRTDEWQRRLKEMNGKVEI